MSCTTPIRSRSFSFGNIVHTPLHIISRGDMMFLELLKSLFFFALHVDNTCVFPKPLTKKDEQECFRRMSEGDKTAKNILIEHNLRLVAHIVKKYTQSAAEQDELISVGTIGLINSEKMGAGEINDSEKHFQNAFRTR